MANEAKKILIISYYWPPAGGPGVQRWLKFAKYLPQFGWQPTLFVPENPSYPLLDESLNSEVSPDLELIKTKIWEPYQLAEIFGKQNRKYKAGQFDVGKNQSFTSKFSIFIRGNFFIPDARMFWVKPSVKYLKRYLAKHHFEALVTTGPPHSLHLIGLELKKELPNLKWIADFRDPWTEISYYKHLKLTQFADKKHHKLEEKVFKNADITLATSFTDAANFQKKGANAVCITNGFDCENFHERVHTKKFTISYVGVLEQLRNPVNLWEVLQNLVEENPEFYADFEMKLVGRVDDKILSNLKKSRLKDHIRELGYLSHQKSQAEMFYSDVLLITNFSEESSKGIIPGKLFEYLQTGHTILSFGPSNSDVAQILKETESGAHFTYQAKEDLKKYIESLYHHWKYRKKSATSAKIEQFSRKNLTKKLVSVLENK